MKSFKMIAAAVVALGLGSLLMVDGSALLNQQVAHAQTKQLAGASNAQQSEGTTGAEHSAIISAAIASAQETTSVTQ